MHLVGRLHHVVCTLANEATVWLAAWGLAVQVGWLSLGWGRRQRLGQGQQRLTPSRAKVRQRQLRTRHGDSHLV